MFLLYMVSNETFCRKIAILNLTPLSDNIILPFQFSIIQKWQFVLLIQFKKKLFNFDIHVDFFGI